MGTVLTALASASLVMKARRANVVSLVDCAFAFLPVFAALAERLPNHLPPALSATCSGHGDWSSKNQLCDCYINWGGDGCELRACPQGLTVTGEMGECSKHGDCEKATGNCKCHTGFEGVTCCPLGCHKHGKCREGKCRCKPGWQGPACLERLLSEYPCANNLQCA
jgi:hypothetical protein